MTKKKNIKKKKKKICDYRDSNPGYMGSKATKVSTTLWRSIQFTDKKSIYAKVINRRVGKMCNPHPHPRKSNALSKHM